jgi:hypothetical protein
MKHISASQQGWATLELVLLLPIIAMMIAVIFYFGQLAFLRLHMTSVTDAATRIAAVKDCDAGKKFVHESLKTLENPLIVECTGSDYITMHVETNFRSSLPYFESIERTIRISATTLNEKKWAEHE